ncbi:peptide/nickel transport system substrate-binding protein [Actinoalloteichus hoggarensis]|uniref:Putative D,D-dipeptide-binding periplasmic protein DdpA n=1 Tax=Actinoalloteichus hoggarensis TaxID=1470176 RepID=A0A221VWH0_9PSEU|nr:ABC transporter substrate-binding protein [Actinoalloteichus hoggarensis]ASO17848.1 putative D,D-dipeptide-binding periplasmic protein DdpA precursor [Actinoalloteichus hoggarensis]MBB5924260.1 peptide/nickel transport system substrate-binding protein [Actinoalloteichus hoggarensis]
MQTKMSRRALLKALGVTGGALAAGALTGCAGPTGGPPPGSVTLGLNRSLVSLDNKLNQFDAAVTVQRAVRQGLTRIGPDLAPIPVLAERFELTAPTQWTVRLREGVRYSDGTPIEIADVETALAMYRQVSGSYLAAFFPEWPEVVPIDEHTFTLETNHPLPVLDYLMANILITPAAANVPEELQTGVGSGPYRVTASNRGTGDYTLRRNENYWADRPRVEQVQVRFMPEESNRVVSLRSGEIDVIDTISPDSAEQLQGLPDIRIDQVKGTRLNQLFYNFRKPSDHPLSRASVRQALSFAIDGRRLAEDILAGSVEAARGPVAETLNGSVVCGEYAYDPRRAKQMLEAEGIADGDLRLTLIWETGEFASDTTVMEAVVQMLGDVGVPVRLRQFEPGGDISEWRQGRGGDWDVLGNGYASPVGAALPILQGMYGGTPERERTRDTYHGYVNPQVVALLDEAYAEVDADRRQEITAELQQVVWDSWPSMWAFVPNSVLAYRRRISDVGLEPTNSYELARIGLEA